MNEQLISQIEELGLSNKEARVYVACLSLGASPVQKIADQAGIKRVTAYVILESLVSLGLVSQSVKGKKTFFNAEEPSNLRRLLDKREQELKEQKQNFEHVLPELLGLKQLPKDSPNVKYYEGVEGVQTIIDSYLDPTYLGGVELIYGFSNLDHLFNFFPDIKDAMSNPRRTRAGLKSQFLYTYSGGPILAESDKANNRVSRFLPPDEFAMSGDFSIIGDHIFMLSLAGSSPMGIAITSAALAQGLRVIFQAAWEAAEKYNPGTR